MRDTPAISDLMRDSVGLVIKLGGPMLVLSMLVGVVVAIFQAVTQIHEQTIGFIFKVVVIVSVLLIGGGWMLESPPEDTREIFALIGS